MKSLFRDTTQKQTHKNSGIAFIIEMLLLLLFVAASLAILVNMFSVAYEQGRKSVDTAEAIHVASNVAEHFCIDPAEVPQQQLVDDFVVTTAVVEDGSSSGTLYSASIMVYRAEDWYTPGVPEALYSLETASYIKAGGA